MKLIERNVQRYTRIGVYAFLALISGAIAFLGFRDGEMGGITLDADGIHVQQAHADAPPPTDGWTGDDGGGGGSDDGGAGGGTGGGGAANGSSGDDGSDGGGDGSL